MPKYAYVLYLALNLGKYSTNVPNYFTSSYNKDANAN